MRPIVVLLLVAIPRLAFAATWTDETLAARPASECSIASDGERRFVFYRAASGHLATVRRELGAPFGAEVDTGIAIDSAPSTIVLGVDKLRVFYRGANAHLWFTDGDGRTFGAPVDLGGLPLSSSPSAVRRDDGQSVFYLGPGARLFESRWDGGPWWSAPRDLGLVLASAPSAIVGRSGMEVYGAALDHTLARATFKGGWRIDIASADPVFFDRPAIAGRAVFARIGGALERRDVNENIAAAASAPGACVADEVFFTGTDGNLHRASRVPDVVSPRYDEVVGTATHNSYWINRNRLLDPYASGTQEHLLDQLLHEHVRALEIDVHTDDHHPGQWSIYHTNRPDFSQVHTLAELVELLRVFQRVVPRHEVVNIVIELKNTNLKLSPAFATENNFGATHTIEQFDRTFRDGLGDALYTPRDLLARAAPGSTLLRAGEVAGWPTIDELRGKFIVNLDGNWASAYYDWHRYAGEGAIADRVAFPLRSIFDAQGNGVPGWPGSAHDRVPDDWLRRARDASIFWQVETLAFPEIPDFVKKHGVVRVGDSFDPAVQLDRIRRGFQLIQTDYPWHTAEPAPAPPLPVDPSRRFHDFSWLSGRGRIDPRALAEPGDRIYVSASLVPTFLRGAGGARFWETTVSTTRVGDTWGQSYPRKAREGGIGGLEAAASPRDWVRVMRIKTGTNKDSWEQEKVTLRVLVSRAGTITTKDVVASQTDLDSVGDTIGLSIDDAGAGSRVRAWSSGRLDPNGVPLWTKLADETFATRVEAEGLVAAQDVLFVNTKISDATGARAATLADLSSIDDASQAWDLSEPARPAPAPVVAPYR